MEIKEKGQIWWLTVFLNPTVTTTIYPNIYVAKGFYSWSKPVRDRILKHERIHLKQQKEVGVWKYLFLYVFCLPFFWNPWRYEWENEAYVKSGTSKKKAEEYLALWNYGWLKK